MTFKQRQKVSIYQPSNPYFHNWKKSLFRKTKEFFVLQLKCNKCYCVDLLQSRLIELFVKRNWWRVSKFCVFRPVLYIFKCLEEIVFFIFFHQIKEKVFHIGHRHFGININNNLLTFLKVILANSNSHDYGKAHFFYISALSMLNYFTRTISSAFTKQNLLKSLTYIVMQCLLSFFAPEALE